MILGMFQDNTDVKAKAMQKSVRKLYCNFSEASFRERLGSIKVGIVRGWFMGMRLFRGTWGAAPDPKFIELVPHLGHMTKPC